MWQITNSNELATQNLEAKQHLSGKQDINLLCAFSVKGNYKVCATLTILCHF